MTLDESKKNILQALYEESATIRKYVDTIATGQPIPYTFLTTTEEVERNKKIAQDLVLLLNSEYPFNNHSPRDWFAEIHSIIPDAPIPEWAFEEWPDLTAQHEPDTNEEFEVVMFKDDAIVDGSRQITSDPDKIEMLKQYAKLHGYTITFSQVKT